MIKSIILEGPNGSGKSTLGEQLAEKFELSYKHAGVSPDNLALSCMDQLDMISNGCILDRCSPISESVYHPDKTDGDTLTALLFCVMRLMLIDSIVIYCTHDGEVKDKDYYPDGHYESILKNRAMIRGNYDLMVTTIPHITYDYENESFEQLLEKMYEYARHYKTYFEFTDSVLPPWKIDS